MKVHSQGVAKRLLSFLLVILSLISMCAVGLTGISAANYDLGENSANIPVESLTSTGAGGTGGDASLFTEASNTAPYVKAEKSSYAIDTPVLVTAGNGARLGLYTSSVTAPTSSDKAIYTYNLSGKEGQTIDLKTGTYNSSSGEQSYLKAGTYNLFLFTTTSGYTVAAQTTIKITNGNVKTIDGTNTYVEASRKVYRYGEPILVKAKAASYANSWVGLYKVTDGVDTADLPKNVAPEYMLAVGTSGISNKDLVANSTVNKKMELAKGDYQLILLSDKNPATATVLGSVSVKVRFGVSISDKSTYGYGEDIITNVEEFNTSDYTIVDSGEEPTFNRVVVAGNSKGSYVSGTSPAVGSTTTSNLLLCYFYSSATTTTQKTYIVSGDKFKLLATSSGGTTTGAGTYNRFRGWFNASYPDYWFWPNVNYVADSQVKIYGTLKTAAYIYSSGSTSARTDSSGSVDSIKFPAGTPFNYLEYYNIYYAKVQIGSYTGYLYHNRWSSDRITLTAELHPSPTTYTADRTASLHQSSVTAASGNVIASYKLTSYPRANVVLQDVTGKEIAADTYKLYAMRNSSYSSYTNKSITVKSDVTGRFAKGAYEVYNLEDGFANGRVAFEINKTDTYGYVGNDNTYAVFYWADSDKKPLEGYDAFYRVPLEKNIVTFDMQPYSIIPEGATGIVAYVQYKDVQGTTGCYVSLPEGCKTYTGLDAGVIAEFNVISDSKLGHTSATQYPNNNAHYKTALVDIAKNSPNSLGIISAGDITAGGTTAQWALIESLRTEAASSAGKAIPNIYTARGNTDDGDGQQQYIDFVNSHGGNINANKLYYSIELGGYKFIFLCDDNGDRKLSATQLNWLDQELADNKINNGDKPVFVVYQYHLVGGALGTYSTDRNENTADVAAVLKKYDNVYMFSGNHRANLASDGNIMGGTDTLPVCINVAATSGTGFIRDSKLESFDDYKDSSHGNYDENSNQGLYVRIYEDKIIILGRNFNTGEWIPESCCVLQQQNVDSYDNITMEFGRTLSTGSYVNVNPDNATIYGGMSSDTNIINVASNGTITVSNKNEGTATATVTAKANDTHVIKRLLTDVRVVKVKDTNYYIKGTFDNWGNGFMLKPTAQANILTATAKISEGTYEFGINSFDDWFRTSVTINDEIESVFLNGNASRSVGNNCTLVATGGTYTFTYNTATTELTVTHKPFTQDETDADALFELADTTDPYLYASSDTYTFGSSIYLTAQGGSWIGVYKADTEIGGQLTYRKNMSDVKAGEAFDLKTMILVGNDPARDPLRSHGSFKAVLFGTEGTEDVIETVYFDVTPSNGVSVDSGNYVGTNKSKYFKSEKIFVTAYSDSTTAGSWVAVVPHGQTVSNSTILYKYTLPVVGDSFDTTPVSLIDYSDLNKNVAIEPGTYDLYLYRSSSMVYPKGMVTFEVADTSGLLSTAWGAYGRGEDIVTNVYTNSSSAYVRMYRGEYGSSLPADDSNLVAWYHVYSQDSFAVTLQEIVPDKGSGQYVSGNTGDPLTLEESTHAPYTIFLVDGTTVLDSKQIWFYEGGSGSVLKGAYKPASLTDGYAVGRVAVQLDENALGYVGTGYVTLQWADANGKPLEGYAPFTEKLLTKTITTFNLNAYTFIPEGAAGFLATVSYGGILSTSENATCFIKIPDGCLPYDVNSGVTSEFQIIADPQLEEDAAAYDTIGSLTEALTDIVNNSLTSAGIFIAGDTTYGHSVDEYDLVSQIITQVEQETGKSVPGVFASMGDSDDGFSDFYNSAEPFMNFVNGHLERAGIEKTIDKPYYSLMIGGYKYIFMCCDAGDNLVSQEQIQWLDEELQENELMNDGKPVFIISHQKLTGTDCTTYYVTISNIDEIAAVTKKYDDVIYFSGHTLYSLQSDFGLRDSVGIFGGTEDLPVTVHAGAVGFSHTLLPQGGESSYSNDTNTGYYVRTYEDKVVLLARNFKTGEWIPDASYVIYNDDIKYDKVFEAVVDDYVKVEDYIQNPNNRELTFTTSDPTIASVDEAGNFKAGIPGEAIISVFAKATDKEVISYGEIKIDVRGEGYPSKYSIANLYDWDNPEPLIFTADKDVVTATVELAPGSYFYAVRFGDDYYGTTAPTVDFTEETLVLDGYDFVNLQATGGYYTFTYRISTKELDIEYEPLDLTETGENTATIYVDFKNSDFTSIPYIYIWDDNKETVNKNIGPLYPGQLLEGPNAEGYYYRTFKYDESYQFIITDGKNIATDASAVHTESEVYAIFEEGVTYTEEKPLRFWVDLTPNDGVSDPIDRLYPVYVDGFYYFYLPSGLNAKAVKFYVDEGLDIKISFVAVKPTGTSINVSGGVTNANTKYRITDLSNKLIDQFYVRQSSSIPSLYTYTDEIMHRETGYDKVNTEYTTSGTYKLLDSSATVEITERELLSLEGIMNDDWTTANNLIGKYSYDLTLAEAQALFEGASASKEYSLIAVNDDESRLRDLTMLELANAIGIEYTSIVQPIDLYNNGYYIGYYLLVEKPAEVDGVTIEFTENNENADFTSDKGQSMIITTADADASEIEALWNAAEEIIYNPDATYEELSSVIDVESFAKMYIIQEFAKTYNAGTTSYTIYYKDGKFHASTAWDFENSLGQSSNDIAGMTGGKFADDATLPLDDPEGWWANSKLMENGELTAQAALCQNEIFWNVVKAEWNEVFYDVASGFTTGEATAVAKLTGKFKELYNLITKSAAMDEVQWGIIKNDPVEGDNRVDTGDTHNDAVLYLNNYYYNRLQWMDETLSQGYTLATPTLKTEKQVYAVNEEIKLTATISSSGMLTYEFYNEAGDLVYTETSDKGSVTYKFSTSEEISEYYTVVITSERAESPVSADALVITEIYELKLEVEAPEELPAGAVLNMTVTSNSDEEVMYILKDKEGNTLAANYTGQFSVITTADEADEYFEYVIEASTTIGSIEYTASKEVTVAIFKFDLSVMLNAEKEVDAGQTINLFALAKSEYELTYTFYNADNGAILDVNKNGYLIINTSHVDADTIKNFYVEVSCEAFDMIFTAKSDIIEVKVVAVTDVYNVTIYFKSTSTLGYRPLISTDGAVIDLTSYEMKRDIFISKNETETASYFWYKAEFTVSKRTPSAFIRILSSRYAMEVQANLLLTENKTYYFAVDNLNASTEIVDLTDASPDERNWCYSATHMVYDPRFDSEEALAEVSARVDLRYVGDTTADGVVNIRDATYIQKGLADIVTMSTTDREVADVDENGKVSIKDATLIQKNIAGINSKSYYIGGNLNETN